MPQSPGTAGKGCVCHNAWPRALGSSCHFHSLAGLITCSLLTFFFRTQGKCQHGNCSTCKARHGAVSLRSSPSPLPELVRPSGNKWCSGRGWETPEPSLWGCPGLRGPPLDVLGHGDLLRGDPRAGNNARSDRPANSQSQCLQEHSHLQLSRGF